MSNSGFGQRERARDWNPPTLDVVVSGHTWQIGAPVVPEVAWPRHQWFHAMREYYDGQRTLHPLRLNFFRRAARFYADLLAAHPPHVVDDEYAPINRGLAEWVHTAGIDLVRFGTSVAQSWVQDGQVQVQDVFPGLWWPSPNGAVVAYNGPEIDQGGARQLVIYDYIAGSVSLHAATGDSITDFAGEMWRDQVALPHLHAVIRPPRLGWYHGSSMYPDLISLVDELERRDSKMSRILDRHAEPILHLEPDPMMDPLLDAQDGEEASARRVAEAVNFWNSRDEGLQVLQAEYKSARYLTWDAQMQAAATHRDYVANAIYDSTAIPAALQNDSRGILATGTSLRRLFLPLHAQLETLRHTARHTALDMANAWSADLGLAALQDGDLVWENPLEVIDRQVFLQGKPADFEDGQDGIDSASVPADISGALNRPGETV